VVREKGVIIIKTDMTSNESVLTEFEKDFSELVFSPKTMGLMKYFLLSALLARADERKQAWEAKAVQEAYKQGYQQAYEDRKNAVLEIIDRADGAIPVEDHALSRFRHRLLKEIKEEIARKANY